MLQGSIANFGKQYVVVLTTTNCATGDSLVSEQFRVESKEKILPALDKAAASLRGRLGESLGSIEKYAMPVEQASTPSLAVLQAYNAGLKALDDKGNLAAIPFFKRATELDPNFAMAYSHLGQTSSDAGIAGPPFEDTTKAFGLRDRTSDRERFYIDSSYYDVVTGEFEKEIQVLEEWRQVYPREAKPARTLAHLYRYLGRYEESLREARDSVRLEPDADSNYDQLVLSALMLNRLDEAQAALQARDPDSYRKAPNLYRLAFLRNDLAGMQKQEARIAGKEGEGLLLSLQSDTEAYHGHLRKARELTRRATEVEVGDKAAGWRAFKSAFEGCFREVFFGSEEARRDVTAVLAVRGGGGAADNTFQLWRLLWLEMLDALKHSPPNGESLGRWMKWSTCTEWRSYELLLSYLKIIRLKLCGTSRLRRAMIWRRRSRRRSSRFMCAGRHFWHCTREPKLPPSSRNLWTTRARLETIPLGPWRVCSWPALMPWRAIR